MTALGLIRRLRRLWRDGELDDSSRLTVRKIEKLTPRAYSFEASVDGVPFVIYVERKTRAP